jgi:hypothetical protein
MKILKMLLPNKLPTAISADPIRIAASDTAISGSEVLTARNKVPTNDSPNPVCSAISLANPGSARAAATTTSAESE